jgi:MurNAc alpha-1-phosphate uridylyltransferase
MSDIGRTAMVLAAGLGVRMRPLTATRPKPLVEIKGKPLIEFSFERLRAAGVKKAVINVHYLADQMEDWGRLQRTPAIEISSERDELLDTGGGVANALPLLGSAPFFVINSDSFWIDQAEPALDRLRGAWDGQIMDCLLLLCPPPQTVGYDGRGDFVLAKDGRVRRKTGEGALVYIGACLAHPRLFEGAPGGKFSMNLLWDSAIREGRLFGISHTGTWVHVGTPGAIGDAERALVG